MTRRDFLYVLSPEEFEIVCGVRNFEDYRIDEITMSMKLRHLEIKLEKAEGFQSPDTSLEQYPTPAPLASGCYFTRPRTGILPAGMSVIPVAAPEFYRSEAALLGARNITRIDCDGNAITVARKNAENFNIRVNFLRQDISTGFTPPEHWDTIVMNPPFGAQKCHADRVFIDFAIKYADIIYMIANRGSIPFVHAYTQKRAEILETFEAKLPIKHLYHFHKKDLVEIPVEILHLRSLPPL